MSAKTHLSISLSEKEFRTNEELANGFMRYLNCFEGPDINEISMYIGDSWRNEKMFILKSKNPQKGLSLKQIADFIKKTFENNRSLHLMRISAFGSFFFDYDKYTPFSGDVSANAWNNEAGLSFSTRSSQKYAEEGTIRYWDNSGKWPEYYDQMTEHFEELKPVSLKEVERIIHETLKRIIESFDVEILSFGYEPEFLHWSSILYFKNPYMFCLEFKIGAEIDDKVKKKLEEIKSVLSLEEIEAMFRKHAEGGRYEVYKSPNGGIGTFAKWGKRQASHSRSAVMAELRKLLRSRGVEIPIGDIEKTFRGLNEK